MMTNSPSIAAPDLTGSDLSWFNVAEPLRLQDLRGRLVILDFWTSCCINCIQVLPTLARIEAAFPQDVAVIGVHSPKFEAEKSPAKAADAVARYGIGHPVVHDPDFHIWRAYGIRAWPTLVFIGPDGRILSRVSGEPDPQRLFDAIAAQVNQMRANRDSPPAPLNLVAPPERARTLRFPSKLKPHPLGGWLLADSGHHQVVWLDATGKELTRYGSGTAALKDGPPGEACFNSPQGVISTPEATFVADTGNHAIRRIDVGTGGVTTLAGTGVRGTVLGGVAPGKSTALASPWDVEVIGSRLYFANAGTHQLGQLELMSGLVSRLAGSGHEDIIDGPAAGAALAQPSGLARSPDDSKLYFVDSETSALRVLSLGLDPEVTTLIGTGLFDFGHRNGPFASALLQHPLGLVCSGDSILLADSYNDSVRIADLSTGVVRDLDEGEFLCADALCVPLSEPAGIAVLEASYVFVVDTNNHRVLRYDLHNRRYQTWLE